MNLYQELAVRTLNPKVLQLFESMVLALDKSQMRINELETQVAQMYSEMDKMAKKPVKPVKGSCKDGACKPAGKPMAAGKKGGKC